MLTVTEKSKNISVVTTQSQWANIVLPNHCAALKKLTENQSNIGGLSSKNTMLAVVADSIKSLADLDGLSKETAKSLMEKMSFRSLSNSLLQLEKLQDKPEKVAVVKAVMSSGLRNKLRQLSLLYLRADTKAYSPEDTDFLLQECEKLVNDKFASFSIAEIEAAFFDAADADFQAYGALNIQLLNKVLSSYQNKRNASLMMVLREAKKMQDLADAERDKARKNQIGYEQALAELRQLQIKNNRHNSFHTCPSHFVKRFISESVFQISPEEKKQIWQEASGQIAYDLLNDAPNLAARKSVQAYINLLQITPTPSGRKVGSDIFRANLKPAFDYSNPQKYFKDLAENYYAKKIYFANIEIFEP